MNKTAYQLIDATSRAGFAALEAARTSPETWDKTSPKDIVTMGDKASEEVLVASIRKIFPKDGIRGEEGSFVKGRDTWFLDPIDGTTNYASGSAFWGVSAGDACGRGIVHLPMDGKEEDSGTWFFSLADGSAYVAREGKLSSPCKLKVQPKKVALGEALLGLDFRHGEESLFGDMRRLARGVQFINSFVWESMAVARGRLDAYAHTGASIFDIAAAIPICKAAGCVVSGFHSDNPVPNPADPEICNRRFSVIISRSPELAGELQKVFAS